MIEHTLPSVDAHRPAPNWSDLHDEPRPLPREASAVAMPLHSALTAGLDRLSHGVALLDIAGRALYANASAWQVLQRLGWGADADEPPLLTSAWSRALEQVCLRGRHEFLRTTRGEMTCMAVLIPAALPDMGLAFTMFSRDTLCEEIELQMFARQHQLTPAETTVLRQLSTGLQAADIALEHGVSRTTVLSQIAAIRAKTCSSSVRHLLGILGRMPPLRALPTALRHH